MTEDSSQPAEGAERGEPTTGRCAIHQEAVALSTCMRCGNFMCAACQGPKLPSMCPGCRARPGADGGFPLTRDAWTMDNVLTVATLCFKREWQHLIPAVFVMVIASYTPPVVVALIRVNDERGGVSTPSEILASLMQFVIQLGLQMGLLDMCVRALRGEPIRFVMMFQQVGKVGQVFLLCLMTWLGMLFSLIPAAAVVAWRLADDGDTSTLAEPATLAALLLTLLIAMVPLTYLMSAVALAMVDLIATPGTTALASMRRAFRLLKGNLLRVCLVFLLAYIGAMMGMVACLIGIFVTMPWGMVVWTTLYLALATERKPFAP